MAVPLLLDPPPVITQSAQSCWAAAFESWAEANERVTGIANNIGQRQLIEWFEGNPDLTTEAGRATPQGITLMAGLGLMRLIPFRSPSITLRVLGALLEHGYLYISYFRRPGAPAHAVVCYGVDTDGIYLMDPWPGRGLITREANYFQTMNEGSLVIGFSMVGDFLNSR